MSTGGKNIYSETWLKAHFGLNRVLYLQVPLHNGQETPNTHWHLRSLRTFSGSIFSPMWWKCDTWVDAQCFAAFPAQFCAQVEIRHFFFFKWNKWDDSLVLVFQLLFHYAVSAFYCSLCVCDVKHTINRDTNSCTGNGKEGTYFLWVYFIYAKTYW